MSGVNLTIWGRIPEGSERFIDESRGRQCCFMSLAALLAAVVPRVHQLVHVLPSEL